ncbi:isoform 2 of e3 ubiquitin-protein ligase march8 [Fagus crenata]
MVKGTDSSGGDVPELEKGTESESESEHNTSGESVTIVICSGDPQKLSATLDTSNSNQQLPIALSPKKPYFSRSTSSSDQCRVCQQEEEEVLIDLGCHCRGGLAKAHRSCIDTWFRIRGSNKCEICQEVAANVPSPDSQPSTNYWVWRIENYRHQDRQRGCFSPLWVAFAILIGGLLLDVLISITLGVSALPINIIIGVIVVLGLGTALRLALEFCHEWSLRRVVQRMETNVNVNLAYHPAL